MGLLNLVVIGIALVGYAHGASVAGAVSGKNCTQADAFHALSCAFRMQDFGSKIQELDIDDKSEMKEFKRSCDALDNCFKTIGHCEGFNDEDGKKAFTMVKTYCGTVNYVANDFAACGQKIDNTNSTCYDDWDPFLDDEDLKDKKKVEEGCKNFFGKDQCLKKEILEHCSKKEWEGFRDHFIALNNDVMKQCDFKNVV
ncbi:unnamed protein product [Caenorhabditis brenneri]